MNMTILNYKAITLIILLISHNHIFAHNKQRQSAASRNNAAVPEYSGGRLGDNLLAIAHTLYYCMQTNCKMLYTPFPYSDQLMLDELVEKYTPTKTSQKNNLVPFYALLRKGKARIKNAIITIPYFPETLIEHKAMPRPSFLMHWEDEAFQQKLRQILAPKEPCMLVRPPANIFSVAVHVRTGGGFDDWKGDQEIIRYKSPLDEYYINQLKNISQLLGGIPIYAFLFTDDKNPEVLAKTIEENVNIPSIHFDYRKKDNSHHNNVLEDLFSMTHFDALIRPESNFSIMAEKLGQHKIIISPGKFLPNSYLQSGVITIKSF
jgi:hypothetical protein